MARKQQPQDKLALFPSKHSALAPVARGPEGWHQHPLPGMEYVHTVWGLGFVSRPDLSTPESREIGSYKSQGNTVCVTCLDDGATGYFAPDSLSVATAVDVSLWQTRQAQNQLLAMIDALVEQFSLSA